MNRRRFLKCAGGLLFVPSAFAMPPKIMLHRGMAGRNIFNPAKNLSSLVFWLSASNNTYNTGTTPATNGQTMASWVDKYSSISFSQATEGNKFKWYSARIGVLPSVTVADSTDEASSASLDMTNGGNTYLCCLVVQNTNTAVATYIEHNPTGFACRVLSGPTIWWYGGTTSTHAVQSICNPQNTPLVVICTRNGTDLATWINGYKVATKTISTEVYPTGAATIKIGDGAIGDYGELLWCNSYQSSYITNITNYFKNIYGIGSNTYVVWDGNSIVQGSGLNFVQSHPGVCHSSLLASSYLGINTGLGGIKTSEMITRFPSLVTPLAGAGKRIYYAYEGTNQLDLFRDVTGSHNLYAQLCGLAQAAGFIVVATTVLPWGTDALDEAARIDYNTLVRNNYTDYATALVDYAEDETLCPTGGQSDDADLTYFQADKIHPNADGQAQMAAVANAVISAL